MSEAEGKLAEISMQEEMLTALYAQVKSGKGVGEYNHRRF